jgi:hypothetical protein
LLAELDITSIFLAAGLAMIPAVIATYRFGRIWRSSMKRYEEWLGPPSLIVETYSNRLRHLESMLIEMRSRLDLVETKLPRTKSQTMPITESDVTSQSGATSKTIAKPTTKVAGLKSPRTGRNDDTRRKILKALSLGPKTSSQLVPISGRSREHTLRLLKAMTESGLISRSPGRPFTYSLTDRGRAEIE